MNGYNSQKKPKLKPFCECKALDQSEIMKVPIIERGEPSSVLDGFDITLLGWMHSLLYILLIQYCLFQTWIYC